MCNLGVFHAFENRVSTLSALLERCLTGEFLSGLAGCKLGHCWIKHQCFLCCFPAAPEKARFEIVMTTESKSTAEPCWEYEHKKWHFRSPPQTNTPSAVERLCQASPKESDSDSELLCAAEIDMEKHLRDGDDFVALTRRRGKELRDMERHNGGKRIKWGRRWAKRSVSCCGVPESFWQFPSYWSLTTRQKKRLKAD